jgi:hypothetical protein
MPAVLSANQVVHEDLSDALILSDVKNTPFLSRVAKGEKLKSMLYSWTAENMDGRKTTPPAENADVTAYEGDAQSRLYNRGERFWRTPRVSVIADRVNDSAGDFGKYTHEIKKFIGDQKRDIEFCILSDQDSNDDNGTVGARFLGLGRVINDGTLAFADAQTAIPAGMRTPAAQIFTGAIATLDEAAFIALMKSRYDALGQQAEQLLFVGSALKAQISGYFGRYVPNKTNYTVIVRTQAEAIDSRKYAGYGIDVYEGDFGTFEIVLTPWIADQYRGYGMAMDGVRLRPLMYCDHTELPYMGGGYSGLIDSILGYEFGDPRMHFKIAAIP